MSLNKIEEEAQKCGQGHLIEHYHSLNDNKQKQLFMSQLERINFRKIQQLYKKVYLKQIKNQNKLEQKNLKPIKNVISQKQIEEKQKQYTQIGFKSISEGQVGICIMSGGQGTRLGFDHPKGMFDIGLQSKYTLFQYFARKLLRLMQITKQKYPTTKLTQKNMIQWYIMTSLANNEQITKFFKQHSYFGYDPQSVHFVAQKVIPAVDFEGKIIIQSRANISLAPSGNGVIYQQMREKGALDHMKQHGIKYLYVGPIDNVLSKLADPIKVGCMAKQQYDILSTFCKKIDPQEKVGVYVQCQGKPQVCQYSEIPKQLAQKKNQNGQLIYCHGNKASMLITVDFIDKVTSNQQIMQKLQNKFHLAQKKIKYYDAKLDESITPEKCNGIKFQLFYFDVFEVCDKFVVFEVLRDEQSAPVKNAEGEDSPETAREQVWKLNAKWVKNAGIITEGQGSIQIDPLVSYNGQGVKQFINAKYGDKIELPIYIH